jgi:hypothetical protein
MNIGDLTVHLTLIERAAREARELLTESMLAENTAKRPTLVLATGGDMNGRMAVPNASAQAMHAAQQMRAHGEGNLHKLVSLCDSLKAALNGQGEEEQEPSQ